MEMMGKIPPHSLEAEQSALGAMILDKDAVTEVVELITDEDFYKEAHKAIFTGIIELYNRNEPVDIVTLSEELGKQGIIDNIGRFRVFSGFDHHGGRHDQCQVLCQDHRRKVDAPALDSRLF